MRFVVIGIVVWAVLSAPAAFIAGRIFRVADES